MIVWAREFTAEKLAEARGYLAAGVPLAMAAQLIGVLTADLDLALWRTLGTRR